MRDSQQRRQMPSDEAFIWRVVSEMSCQRRANWFVREIRSVTVGGMCDGKNVQVEMSCIRCNNCIGATSGHASEAVCATACTRHILSLREQV